jgi:hypothetical protein
MNPPCGDVEGVVLQNEIVTYSGGMCQQFIFYP